MFLCCAKFALPFTTCPHKSQEIVEAGSDITLRDPGGGSEDDGSATGGACGGRDKDGSATGGACENKGAGVSSVGGRVSKDDWWVISDILGSGIAAHSLSSAVELRTTMSPGWFNWSRLASPDGVSQSV